MTIKTCSKCGFVGDVDLFVRNENKCKWCEKAYKKAYYKAYRKAQMKAHYKANSENIKAQQKAYRKANSEHIKAQQKAYRKANSEHTKELAKEYDKARVDSLLDSYVVRSLNMKKEEVTPELLELKRDQLKIFRLLREAKNGIT